MRFSRRRLLQLMSALPIAAGVSGFSSIKDLFSAPLDDWQAIRDLFVLTDDKIHMSAMLLSSHPRQVRDAIAQYREGLDLDTVAYLEANMSRLTEASRKAAGKYLDIDPSHIALTDSTTMGVALAYNGLMIRSGQEILTTEDDYFVTHESVRLKALASGASVRKIPLYENAADAQVDSVVSKVLDAVQSRTRLLALTWVHSSTGMKLPIRAIADGLAEINSKREIEDHVLLGVDGVHGFGVEDVSFPQLGCDMLMAGCHKWLFGPRGTGIVAFSRKALDASLPIIPSFTEDSTFDAWLQDGAEPAGDNNGARMTPGGFKSFEHIWAMKNAFDLHFEIGKRRVAERTHHLATMLKEELSVIDGVVVRTPMAADLSAGIVSFDIEGWSPVEAVSALRKRSVVASVAPYTTLHIRLTPSIRNLESEIKQVAADVRALL